MHINLKIQWLDLSPVSHLSGVSTSFYEIYLKSNLRILEIIFLNENVSRSSHCGSVVMNRTSVHEDEGPGLAQWVKDPALRELWYRLQTRLGSSVAVVQTDSCSSDSTPSLGTSMCWGCGSTKKKKKKKENASKTWHQLFLFFVNVTSPCWGTVSLFFLI